MSIIFLLNGMLLILCQLITLLFYDNAIYLKNTDFKGHNQPTGLFKTCKVAPLLKKRLRTKEKKE